MEPVALDRVAQRAREALTVEVAFHQEVLCPGAHSLESVAPAGGLARIGGLAPLGLIAPLLIERDDGETALAAATLQLSAPRRQQAPLSRMVLPTYHHALASYAPAAKMGGEPPAPQLCAGRHSDPIGTKSRGVSRTWRLRGTTPPAGDQRVRNGGRAGQILAQSAQIGRASGRERGW